jgi:fucose permease
MIHASEQVKLSEILPAGYLTFTLLGAAGTLYGPILIHIAAETQQPVSAIGAIFILHWLGFFASTLTTNRVARRLEMRRTVLLGCLSIGTGMLGLAALPFPFSIAAAFFIGFGSGMLEIVLNRLVEFLAGNEPAAWLTRLHTTFGVGAILIPLIVAGAVWFGLGWRVGALVLAGLSALTAIVVWRWREFSVDHGAGADWRGFPWRSIVLFVIIFIVYVGLETAVGGWATTFFSKLGQGPFLGALATSLFFLTFTFGRIVLATTVERIGYARSVRLANALGAVALLFTFIPQLALIGFGLAGIALSIVFPTLLAWAARTHPEIRAQMASLSIASAGIGGVTIPYAIGVGVDAFGAWSLTPMLIVTALVVAGLTLFENGRVRLVTETQRRSP